jgi:DNA invertase Pin-like site-specific DNA recombinase
MDKPAGKLLRCAIYTRKSTEHNLDLEFNSLDAQREACEAYIKSQAHEGWRLAPGRYDDSAFSGASLDRPALKALLAEVRSRQIDVIEVNKVDRQTPSLADFAKLVELFDQHSVSFVSVTQHFNTTSSMGRLTLNVLLSFAQFEREVIGERVRDKIAASKRKGMWVGGPVPLGYASVNKKIVVVPEEADTVRLIFRRYLELGSIRSLVQDLDLRGVRTKQQALSGGRKRGGIRFGVGPLAHLLRNRFYVGDVVYRGNVHRGEHDPILDQTLFEAVQAKLAAAATARQLLPKGSPAILAGRIFDDRGNRMTPTHTNKRGARYRYYVSHAILQNRNADAGSAPRIPAPEVERAVVAALRERLATGQNGKDSNVLDDRALIEQHVKRVAVKRRQIEIQLTEATCSSLGNASESTTATPCARGIIVPWSTMAHADIKGIIHSPNQSSSVISAKSEGLLIAIAKARIWINDLLDGRVASFAEIAEREGRVERHIRLLAPLAFVSPRIVSHLINGAGPSNPTVTGLAQGLAYSWAEQDDYPPSSHRPILNCGSICWHVQESACSMNS